MFNPAGMIYQQVDKRIQQGKLISEKKTVGRPKGKGMLVRSNNKEKVDAKQKYNEPLDFVVDVLE